MFLMSDTALVLITGFSCVSFFLGVLVVIFSE